MSEMFHSETNMATAEDEIIEELSAEVRLLRTDNESLQRILTDMQQDSHAYLRGLDDASKIARGSVYGIFDIPRLDAEAREVTVSVDKIELSSIDGKMTCLIDGRPSPNVWLTIHLFRDQPPVLSCIEDRHRVGDHKRIAELELEVSNLRWALDNLRPPPGADWEVPDRERLEPEDIGVR